MVKYTKKKYMDIDKKLSETIKKFKVAKKQVDNFEKNKNKAQETLYSATKDVERANTDYIMYSNEYRDGTVTEEDFTNAINNLKKAQENYKEMQYQYAQEVELLKDAQYKKGYLEKQINNFITELNKVEFELMQATVVAPSNAKIAEQNVHLHDMVQKNATLFILAPDSCSVDAKFEKNDKIQIGQKAQVLLKSYPYPLKGTVEGIKEDGTVKIIIKSNVVKCNTDTKEEDIKVKVKVR